MPPHDGAFRRIDAQGNTEPFVEEMLADPVIRAVMRRDAVSADEVRRLLLAALRGHADQARAAAGSAWHPG